MNIFETIGVIWIVFGSTLSTVGIIYFAWQGISTAWRQRQRGETEEHLDIRRSCEDRYLIDRAGKAVIR